MKIKQKAFCWKWYAAVAAFSIGSIITFNPAPYYDIGRYVKESVKTYIVKSFDLASPLTPSDTIPALLNLTNVLLAGSFPVHFEELYIDVKFKHLRKMEEERTLALKMKFMFGQGFYPALITFQGRKLKASIRLKGDFKDHWIGPDRWSFRVKLKNGESIFGYSRFSIQKPKTRSVPHDHLYQYWLRESGNIAPRHRYVRTYFNGDYWGIMDVEEHMSKQMLELAEKKEAPIIRLKSDLNSWYERVNGSRKKPRLFLNWASEISLYGDNSYRNNRDMLMLYSYAIENIIRYENGNLPIEELIDVDSFSRALFTAIVWQRSHTLAHSNSRFYLNPYTLKLEQITTDQPNMYRFDTVFNVLSKLHRDLVNSEGFKRRFDANMKAVSSTSVALEDEYARFCNRFPVRCPMFDSSMFRSNLEELAASGIEWFEKRGSPEIRKNGLQPGTASAKIEAPEYSLDVKFPRHVYAEHFDDGELVVFNMVDLPVEILSVILKCKAASECNDQSLISMPIKLGHGIESDGLPVRVSIFAPAGVLGKDRYIEIRSRVSGFAEQLTGRVRLTRIRNLFNPLSDGVLSLDSLIKLPFVKIEEERVIIRPGVWDIDSPMVLPRGIGIDISPGTTLRFAPQAYIVVQEATFNAEGSAQRPIVFRSMRDLPWKGIYVLNSGTENRWSNATVANTNFLRDGVLMLSGGVTFYRSPVAMNDVSFAGSTAEDMLNIVHSPFVLTGVDFTDARSDAFDSDFSKGVITGALFRNIGGDGLDTSGSKVEARDLDFSGITDKAISAGENSEISVFNATISNVGAGLVSKDGSVLNANNITFENFSLFAGMTYRKKSIYGHAEMNVTNSGVGVESYFNQTGNSLIIDGSSIAGKNLGVEELYASGPMQKIQ